MKILNKWLTLVLSASSLGCVLAGIFIYQEMQHLATSRRIANFSASGNNLKRIAMAVNAYHDYYKTEFPVSRENVEVLNGRILLLPFLDEKGLYNQIRDRNSNNTARIKKKPIPTPDIFTSPYRNVDRKAGYTSIFLVRLSEKDYHNLPGRDFESSS